MRLLDLNPRWWARGDGRRGMGLTFDCPGACCAARLPTTTPGAAEAPKKIEDHPHRRRLGVAFANPIDGGASDSLVPHHDGAGHVIYSSAPEWTRTGDTFETLSLHPSVDASAAGHWHGFITDGVA